MSRIAITIVSLHALLAASGTTVSAHEGIHTNRPSPVILPLPKGDDVFHFVVFGDRTGGPAEGIQVLAQAVGETNLLDPDLVMTVGDLVNGYNQTPQWLVQMEEFRATMSRLKMPWFPVAGNHDIYWRKDSKDSKGPEDKPPREHEEHYEKHFGPLWYWFEHKKVGFLVLFTDEGHADGRVRSYADPAQQRLSPAQMEWLRGAIEAMKGLQHVFVFLHHPFWMEDRYPGGNWDEVHRLLVANRNVRAVLAGHIHRMTYSGQRDGIDYYSLATTGGTLPKDMEGPIHFGYLHHYNVVTVRATGYTMASIPVGGVFDPKQFGELRQKDVDHIRRLRHRSASPPIALGLDGAASALYRIAVDNPSSLPIEVTLTSRAQAPWAVAPDHRHRKVEAGERVELEFACLREPSATLDGERAPELEMRVDVLAPGARIAMPARTLRVRTRLVPPPAGWPVAAKDGQMVFAAAGDCVRLERELLPPLDGPFTIEAWIRAAAGDGGGAIVSDRKDRRGFGIEVGEATAFILHTATATAEAKAPGKLPAGKWTHVAGVHDGERIALFIDGRRVATALAPGGLAASTGPLHIAARPGQDPVLQDLASPVEFWSGAVDDVRLSRGARYLEDFTPPRQLESDAATLLRLPCDQRFGDFLPVTAGRPFPAEIEGKAQLVHEAGAAAD